MKLVTGGYGFIGVNLNVDVRIGRKDVDLRDFDDTVKILKHYKPTTVIHTAARHGNFKDMSEHDVAFIQDNIRIDLNVIEACRQSGVENLLMLSSITSFPSGTPLPYKETHFFDGDVPESTYGYSVSKKLSVSLCKAYQKEYGLNYKSVLLGNVYGPNNHFSDNSTVISTLIYKCYNAKIHGTDLYIYGDGSPIRDFIYVSDLNDIFDTLIASNNMEPKIVSSGKLIDIRSLVDIIVKCLNFKGNVIWGNQSNMGQLEKYSDISKLKSIILDFKFTSIEDGIKKTCDWYIANQKTEI